VAGSDPPRVDATAPIRDAAGSAAADLGSLVVAIDGPAGAGKSTVARAVARRLGLRYLDTGAMYRAVTLAALERGIDPHDAPSLGGLAADVDLQSGTDPERPTICIGSRDVTVAVRRPDVTTAVSPVAAVPEVRRALVARQQAIIGGGGIVVEGRDIGRVVAPHAQLKIFLTASGEERARRRRRQAEPGTGRTRPDVQQELERRDRLDAGRAVSPMTKDPDALEIDSTEVDAERVADMIVGRVRNPSVVGSESG
jgi:cytidylate kinase